MFWLKGSNQGQQNTVLFHILMKWSFIISLRQSDQPNHLAKNNIMCCIRVIRHNESRLMSFAAHQLVCLGCRNRQRWCLNFMAMTAGYHSRIMTLGVNCHSGLVGKRHWPTFLTELYIRKDWRHVLHTKDFFKSVMFAKKKQPDQSQNKCIPQ